MEVKNIKLRVWGGLASIRHSHWRVLSIEAADEFEFDTKYS